MKIVIPECFPNTRHRLCMWHIMQKLVTKVGTAICNKTDFKRRICDIVWTDQILPYEFEREWEIMIEDFKIDDNKWLQDMFDIRESWIPAFLRDELMAGLMRTTSRSESENNFFGKWTSPHLTLVEFLSHYDTAIVYQRLIFANLKWKLNVALKNAKPFNAAVRRIVGGSDSILESELKTDVPTVPKLNSKDVFSAMLGVKEPTSKTIRNPDQSSNKGNGVHSRWKSKAEIDKKQLKKVIRGGLVMYAEIKKVIIPGHAQENECNHPTKSRKQFRRRQQELVSDLGVIEHDIMYSDTVAFSILM
ncbi:FAR1-related sequence 5-like protein [Tanacetum coccineum]|uniref:FAR1-related sequence 5-like protein n=1 Tax=Tanacetum coccineum TaxID=301880 RepID=A0ABQ4XIN7_9ASTR